MNAKAKRGGRQGLTMLDTRTNCASTKATKRCKRLGGWCGAAASAAGCMSCNNVEGGGKSSCKVLRPPGCGGTNALKASQMLQFCNVTQYRSALPLRQHVAKEKRELQSCPQIAVTWSIGSWAAAACVCRASLWAASPSPGTGAQGRTLGRQWRVSLLLVFAVTPAPRR